MPKKIGDYMDNLTIDLVNYAHKADLMEKKLLKMKDLPIDLLETMDKLRWYGHQIKDNYSQIINILRERGIYKTIRGKEQL